MATKAAVDDYVIERRLRPIYEWLDIGASKKAIQECDKVLKKQPGLQCALVLKGLAWLRCGKPDEAAVLIAQVVAECPTDDATLQALTIYFREIDDYDKICGIYEEATKRAPKNEELFSHLFMSYVRVSEYKKQQQAAMALYKLKPKNPYYFWAVISLVMQSQNGDNQNKTLCLTLAERMVEKFYKQGKLESEAEVMAYLYILELQEKFVDALDLLDSDLSDRVTQQPANFLSLKRVHYHLSLKNWQPAHDLTKALISSERDNWQHYENFCKSLLQLQLLSVEDSGADDITLLQNGRAFLRNTLKTSIEEHGIKYRAPYLALMLLAKHLHANALQRHFSKLDIDIGVGMLEYLRLFGHKWCAFSDIRPYLVLVPYSAIETLCKGLKDLVILGDNGVPEDVSMLHRHLTWHQVSRCLEPVDTSDAQVHLKTADELVHLYNCTHHLACQTTATDIRRNDIYLLLAGHSVLHAIALLQNEVNDDAKLQYEGGDGKSDAVNISQLIVKLVSILEAGVDSSKANFQLKLLLLQLYNMIGACGSGRNCYDSLEIKSVQLDTLGHIGALQAVDAAHYSLAQRTFSLTNYFFLNASKDTCEPMIQAYKYGSLTRVPEFGRFRERLQHSAHFASVVAEQMLMDLTYSTPNHKAAMSQLQIQAIDSVTDTTDYDALLDNCDHSVKINWQCLYNAKNVIKTDADHSVSEIHESAFETSSSEEHTGTKTSVNSDSETTVAATNGILKKETEKSSKTSSNSYPKPCEVTIAELRVRQITLRVLGAGYQAAIDTNEASIDRLSHIVQELDSALAVQLPEKLVQLPGVEQAGVRRLVGQYLANGAVYGRCIQLHAKLLLRLHAMFSSRSENDVSATVSACRVSVEAMVSAANDSLALLRTTASTAALTNTKCLFTVHHTAQTVGIVCVLLGFCSSLLRGGTKQSGGKRKGKKKEVPALQVQTVTEFSKYIDVLDKSVGEIHAAISTKLQTAKQNSCNNARLYAALKASLAVMDVVQEGDNARDSTGEGNTEKSKVGEQNGVDNVENIVVATNGDKAVVDREKTAKSDSESIQSSPKSNAEKRPKNNSTGRSGKKKNNSRQNKKQSSDSAVTKTTEDPADAISKLSLDDRITSNGVEKVNAREVQINGSVQSNPAHVGNGENKEKSDSAANGGLQPVPIDFVQTCLSIDSSYQESLDNLSVSLFCKKKYIASIKL